jgi:hypothetical protein
LDKHERVVSCKRNFHKAVCSKRVASVNLAKKQKKLLSKKKTKSLSFDEVADTASSGGVEGGSLNKTEDDSSWKRRWSFAAGAGGGGVTHDIRSSFSELAKVLPSTSFRQSSSSSSNNSSAAAAAADGEVMSSPNSPLLHRRSSFDALRHRVNSYGRSMGVAASTLISSATRTNSSNSNSSGGGGKHGKCWNPPPAVGIDWNSEIHHVVTDLLRTYFETSQTDRLPPDVLEEVFRYMHTHK